MQPFILKLREKYILHPFLVVILFVFTEQKLNFIISANNFLCAFIFALVFILPISLFLYFCPAQYKPSLGLWLSFLFSFIFFGDNLQDFVVSIMPSLQAHARIMYFVLVFVVLFSILVFKTYKKQLFSVNLYLNYLLIGFCLLELGGILQHFYQTKRLTEIDNETIYEAQTLAQNSASDSLPNIYFILTDAYTNANSLKKFWQEDNQPFLDSMQKHHYYNVKNAKSNYFYTKRTLAAILNGQYLTEYFKEKHLEFCNQAINNSSLGSLLVQNGYETTTISPFIFNKKVDNLYSNNWTLQIDHNFEHLYLHYLEKTLLKFVVKFMVGNKEQLMINEMYKNMSLRALKKFKESIEISSKKPKLVYLHLFIAHYPFIFTDKGDLRTDLEKENSV
jgi:hypothetical protein